jgi:hypothetical protein
MLSVVKLNCREHRTLTMVSFMKLNLQDHRALARGVHSLLYLHTRAFNTYLLGGLFTLQKLS